MAPFNLLYYRPDTVDQALDLFRILSKEQHHPAFYGGGTEILTRVRVQDARFDAVIDLKAIPEVLVHREYQGSAEFGAGLRLTHVANRNLWPLLTATADRVADHTVRSQITLGGNLLSALPYREAILPFLISDSAEAKVATIGGMRTHRVRDRYDQTFKLKPGDFLVSLVVDGHEIQGLAFKSRKMTRIDWIDYPLVTIALIRRRNGGIRAAFSGWAGFPFVSSRVDKILSNGRRSPSDRAKDAVEHMPMPALSDTHGSRAYREFVTQYTLAGMLEELEEET